MNPRPHILMLGQYPLETLDSAPKIRTWFLWKALEQIAEVTFVTGTRKSRRAPLIKLIRQGNLKKFDAVYLEAATSTSMEIDLLLLFLLKSAKIPIGIYIRDAYPLFGLSPVTNLKELLLNWAWYISQWFYRQVADILFFPTQSLADCFDFKNKQLLPPASQTNLVKSIYQGPFDTLFFAGNLNQENGWSFLKETMEKIYRVQPSIRLLALTPTQLEDNYPWLEIRRGVLKDILDDLPRIAAALIPRPQTAYNNLAIPVKLMDYFSLGLPVISTPCLETAKIIVDNNLGIVSAPNEFDKASLYLIQDRDKRNEISSNIIQNFLSSNSWDKRASDLLSILLQTQDRFSSKRMD
ncbi:hypothetical protein COW36_24360 [bacterium (Candidatus Blackallbacteria) CG17_big_fil_post_rev_8_21_14_2_50_48_46]|uniref:Glycosyltransferase n=1 Tax=bacterium (Candidatus Blackallbacteria) CG17_big_fil_post_rev_8_21_14_2_50_48_46 TaxID=2014261 RepID=A0A2M7FXT7_9BACT|nr:MAG: hypothetical protein COW64_19300 [bacterium (Candidatus Blackallbacteria) CG18_big_fil_WC_8_21_14_2_50_49_26]PIW13803.1 MAG: hypothetical protein COW36_24360 [bacterium (Candidatus Blackallbacteria) CG17_big_fil_post_rev_8_21_14_2_50_48_46]PIW45029.1 MAG: hypothetical protein COW20_21990 [bacterium (Candidatus Blackallbacteria) CG13_big_fil_rev_8_21_14_2_50_49_14]